MAESVIHAFYTFYQQLVLSRKGKMRFLNFSDWDHLYQDWRRVSSDPIEGVKTLNLLAIALDGVPAGKRDSLLVHSYQLCRMRGFGSSSSLGEALVLFGRLLCRNVDLFSRKELVLLARGAGAYLSDEGKPQHIVNAELSLVYFAVGLLLREDWLFEQALLWVNLSLEWWDADGNILAPIWIREDEYDRFFLSHLYLMLFSVASCCSNQSRIHLIADRLRRRGAEEMMFTSSPLPEWLIGMALFFCRYLPKKGDHLLKNSRSLPSLALSLGYFSIQKGSCLLSVVCSGSRVGMGALSKGKITVPSFGPQRGSQFDPQFYGIEHSVGSEEWNHLSHQDGKMIRTVSKMVCVDGELSSDGSRWLSLSACLRKEKLWLEVAPSPGKEELFFSFFFDVDCCFVGDKKLLPETLDGYKGANLPLRGLKGGEVIHLIPCGVGYMEVIPLSLGSSFWGAKFLVSFLLHTHSLGTAWYFY